MILRPFLKHKAPPKKFDCDRTKKPRRWTPRDRIVSEETHDELCAVLKTKLLPDEIKVMVCNCIAINKLIGNHIKNGETTGVNVPTKIRADGSCKWCGYAVFYAAMKKVDVERYQKILEKK